MISIKNIGNSISPIIIKKIFYFFMTWNAIYYVDDIFVIKDFKLFLNQHVSAYKDVQNDQTIFISHRNEMVYTIDM